MKAELKYLRISPRKVRLLANKIKGLPVKEAEQELLLSVKRSAKPLLKLLKSAVANAQTQKNLTQDQLYIKNIEVNEGPRLKRFRPRAFRRATLILKRTSHIKLQLAQLPEKLENIPGSKASSENSKLIKTHS